MHPGNGCGILVIKKNIIHFHPYPIMDIASAATPSGADKNVQWTEFRNGLYSTLETMAREKIWFIVGVALSVFAVQILIFGIQTALFGFPPEKGEADPAAAPRFLLSLIGNAYSFFISVGAVRVVRAWSRNQEAGWDELKRTSFVQWLKCLATFILFGFGTVVGFILLIVPGIWFALTYQFAFTAMAADPNLGIMDAFRRSKSITQGNRWNILVTSIHLGLKFWWRKGGKRAFLGILGSLAAFVIIRAAGAPNALSWIAYAAGFLSILGFVNNFVNLPLIFFGLTNGPEPAPEVPAEAPENPIETPFGN
jgi:hypothetical protein